MHQINLHFFALCSDKAKIWEIYKLVPERDLVIRELGVWTRQIGMDLTTLEKWQRRGDLTVKIYPTHYAE